VRWKLKQLFNSQNGGRRHLKFIIFVHFGQMVYFRWQLVASLQNFIHLRQSAAELLMFVQKIQDGNRRHLGFNFCSIFWHNRM